MIIIRLDYYENNILKESIYTQKKLYKNNQVEIENGVYRTLQFEGEEAVVKLEFKTGKTYSLNDWIKK